MAIDAHRVEPYSAQPVASKYDYIDKDSKLQMSENLKTIMVNSEKDLTEIASMYKPGAIAYTPGFTNIWHLNASGEWVSILGGGSDDMDSDTKKYVEYFVKTVSREITEINDDQELVSSIGNAAFANCSGLTTVSFPKATSIGNSAFASCSGLTTVSLPKATSIGNSAFAGCSGLTTVSFPEVTSIDDDAFGGCSSLTTVSLPKATSIGIRVFGGCSNLTTVSFLEATSIGNSAFTGCSGLTTVSLPKATSIGNSAFGGCNNMTDLYLPNAENTYTNRSQWALGSNVTVHYNTSFDADGNPII